MKITFSPLIAAASNRVADAVFASWKGIAYVRKYVIPTYRNTAPQIAVRDAIRHLNPLWQSLVALARTAWAYRCVGQPMSAWNLFVKVNHVKEKTDVLLEITPYNKDVLSVSNFLAEPHPVTALHIVCNWLLGDALGTDSMKFDVRRSGTNRFQAPTFAATTVSQLTADLTLPDIGPWDVYAFPYRSTVLGAGQSVGTLNVLAKEE